MKTRIKDVGGGFSFQYAEVKRPQAHEWTVVGGDATPLVWPTPAARDKAKACFTHRRSVAAAMADLTSWRLLP